MDNHKCGEFIKALRVEEGLTQKELAEKINCTDKAVSRWETGKGMPDISLLLALSQYFGVSINELLLGERIEKEQVLEKSDKVIINTIKGAIASSKRQNRIIFVLFLVIQIFIEYAPPLTAQPGDEMGIAFFLIGATAVNAFFFGFTTVKYKWVMAVLSALIYIPVAAIIMDDNDLLLYYTPLVLIIFIVMSYIAAGISALTRIIIKLIKSK